MSDDITHGFDDSQESIPTELPETEGVEASNESVEDAPEKQIGPYRLIKPLGEGGMGLVWLAEQREPVKRLVALKVIKPGMDSKQVVARFEAERQALALMEHPAIAKVHDAGSTRRGRPYFAMEYVKGQPISDYCDEKRLTNRERLQLFMLVCDGVQHAHQKAVIHRDLKPSNVLITEQDGKPVPKIIDFGVAKAITQELTDKTIHTQLGGMIGTPAYMSPEQAVIGEQDIDTRSDVYALGVMLYELLVGALPFEMNDLRKVGYEAMVKKIREEDPLRPSSRISTLGADSTETAGRRGTELPTLRRELSGDLDWITMRALEKERERRYASPSEFAADIARFLKDEPVVARPPSPAYLARKFFRRHSWGVGAAAAGLLLLTAFAITTSVQAKRIAEERDLAEQIVSFQADMLSQIDLPTMGRSLMEDLEQRGDAERFRSAIGGVNTTDVAVSILDRSILSRALTTLEERFSEQPIVDSRLRGTIGRLYRHLGRLDQSEPLLVETVETLERELGRDDPVTLASILDLGVLYLEQGRFEESEQLIDEAVRGFEGSVGRDDGRTLDAMRSLGNLLAITERHDEAESVASELIDRAERAYGMESPVPIRARELLASVRTAQGRHKESQEILEQTMAAKERLFGRHDEETLATMDDLALSYSSTGMLDEARVLLEESLEAYRASVGNDHPFTLDGMTHLANLYRFQGEFAKSDALYAEAVAGRRRIVGDDHVGTLMTRFNQATSLLVQGQFDAAEPILLEILEAYRRIYGNEHGETLNVVNNLSALHINQGQFAKAERWAREAVDAGVQTLGTDHPFTLDAELNLAIVEWGLERYDDAETHARIGVEGLQRIHGDDSPLLLGPLDILQTILMTKGDLSGAKEIAAIVTATLHTQYGEGHAETATPLYNLACLQSLDGMVDEALASLSKAIDAGFSDLELMRTDSDLDTIRGDEFDSIVRRAESRF